MLILKEKSFYRRFFMIALVIAGQNLLSFGVNLADNLMLGNYDQSALSGNALSDQIQFFIQMTISGLSEGVVVFGSQYWGQKRTEPIKTVAAIACRISFLFCIVMFIACFSFPSQIIGLLTNDSAVVEQGAKLLRLVSCSYIFFGVTTVLLASLRSVEIVKIGLIISAVTLVISFTLNYILINGIEGFSPRLGILGAGTATIVTRIIEFLIVLGYIKWKDKRLQMRFRELLQWNKSYFQDYYKVVLPIVAAGSIWGFAGLVQTSILGHLEPDVIAANAVAIVVFQIVSSVPYGTANAAGVLTGKAVGIGDIDYVKRQTRTLQCIFLAIGVLFGLILFVVKDYILLFYGELSPEALYYGRQFMTVLSITLVGTAYQMSCLTGIVRNGGDTKFVFKNDMIFVWLIVVPSAYFSVKLGFPPVVTFVCLKSDQVLKCFVAVFKVNSYNWIKRLTRA